MSNSKIRKQRQREINARVAELLKTTGYVPVRDLFDAQRRQMDWLLLKDFIGDMQSEDRMFVLDHGFPPFFPDARVGREGFSAKLKKDSIEIEYWCYGKKQNKRGITIPIADWPTHEDWRVGVPNLPFAQSDIARNALVSMFQRTLTELDPCEIELRTTEIRKAIYRVLPESTPEQSKPKERKRARIWKGTP